MDRWERKRGESEQGLENGSEGLNDIRKIKKIKILMIK